MPHHRTGDQPEREDCGLGAYPSVYGDLELCAGSQLTSFAPALPAAGQLDLDGISDDQRTAIVDALEADVAATPAFPSDTYFGGKALNRAASLVVLGEQLGVPDVVADLRTTTVDALEEWAEPDGCTRARRPVRRLRRGRPVGHRPHAVLRVGRAQRPPLPLRLHPGRGGAAREGRPGPRGASSHR